MTTDVSTQSMVGNKNMMVTHTCIRNNLRQAFKHFVASVMQRTRLRSQSQKMMELGTHSYFFPLHISYTLHRTRCGSLPHAASISLLLKRTAGGQARVGEGSGTRSAESWLRGPCMERDRSPVISADGSHHECCPAKSVPCVDICTFGQ